MRGDEYGRQWATIVLVFLSFGIWLSLAFTVESDLALTALDGDPWRFVTAVFLNDGTAAQLAAVTGARRLRLAARAPPRARRAGGAVRALRSGGARRRDRAGHRHARVRRPPGRARPAVRVARSGPARPAPRRGRRRRRPARRARHRRRAAAGPARCRRASIAAGLLGGAIGALAGFAARPGAPALMADATLHRRGGRRGGGGAVRARALRPRPGDRHPRGAGPAARPQRGARGRAAGSARPTRRSCARPPAPRIPPSATARCARWSRRRPAWACSSASSVGFELARELEARRADHEEGSAGP